MNIDFPGLRQLGCSKRTDLSDINDQYFEHGLQELRRFSIELNGQTLKKLEKPPQQKKLIYIIEIHVYEGFAMIKYYPRNMKNHPEKYKLRAETLGYMLNISSFRHLLNASTYLMKLYLDINKNNFIGYIGQPDDKDDLARVHNKTAKRARAYNRWVATMFQSHKFAIVNPEIFRDENINLVRNAKTNQYHLSSFQQTNYDKFLTVFEGCGDKVLEFMTKATKEKYLSALKTPEAKRGLA